MEDIEQNMLSCFSDIAQSSSNNEYRIFLFYIETKILVPGKHFYTEFISFSKSKIVNDTNVFERTKAQAPIHLIRKVSVIYVPAATIYKDVSKNKL